VGAWQSNAKVDQLTGDADLSPVPSRIRNWTTLARATRLGRMIAASSYQRWQARRLGY